MTPSVRAFGDRAVLVDLPDSRDVERLTAALGDRPTGIVDVVSAQSTVLVAFEPRAITGRAVRSWIESAPLGDRPAAGATDEVVLPVVVLPVIYDGGDLDALASALGIPSAELVDRHVACRWRVAFGGFAPGFGYLVSDDWDLEVPRRTEPRTRVPAGSVALAGAFSGVYPRPSPGGWQLVGRTGAPLWDPARRSPALLPPGTPVRFERVG